MEKFKIRRPSVKSTSNEVPEGYDLSPETFGFSKKFTGKGVKIAILSSGLPSHKELSNIGDFEIFDDYCRQRNNIEDNHGQATMIGGLISGKCKGLNVGIAPDSELYFSKICRDSGEGDSNAIVASILWSIVKGVDIIIIPCEVFKEVEALELAIEKAVESNIAVLSLISKNNKDMDVWPASYPKAMAVTTGKCGDTHDAIEVNLNSKEVYTCYENKKYIKSKTPQMGCAIVAGLAACLIEKYRQEGIKYSPAKIYSEIYSRLLKK